MLIALMTILLLGGSSSFMLDYIADARDIVRDVVPRGERRSAALDALKAMRNTERAYRKHLKAAGKDLFEALELPDDVESEIDAFWTAHFAVVQQHNTDMLDGRFEFREQLTREEWNEIFPSEPAEQ